MNIKKVENKVYFVLVFTISLMIIEITGGILSKSLALFSDATHMLTDSMALLLSYIALIYSKKPPTPLKSYGYHRLEIIISLINGLMLFLISLYIIYEALIRILHPVNINIGIMTTVATIGLLGNLFGILFLKEDINKSINIKSAYYHLISDMLSSFGVIISSIIISFTHWFLVDSIIGILIGGVVLRSALSLIMESGDVLLESTPKDIDITKLKQDILSIPGIKDLHEIHIWTITSDKRAFSGHITIDNITTKESQKILCLVKELLEERFNITHSTIEVECDKCINNLCEYQRLNEKVVEKNDIN